MSRQGAIFCLLVLFTASVSAAEIDIYESLAGVEIGRVFLSQQERQLVVVHGTSASGKPAATTVQPQKPSSAGYIIGRNGRQKVWKDGDFVAAAGVRSSPVTFPGDVPIVHHGKRIAAESQAAAVASEQNATPVQDDD
jgi:hypothetical protein